MQLNFISFLCVNPWIVLVCHSSLTYSDIPEYEAFFLFITPIIMFIYKEIYILQSIFFGEINRFYSAIASAVLSTILWGISPILCLVLLQLHREKGNNSASSLTSLTISFITCARPCGVCTLQCTLTVCFLHLFGTGALIWRLWMYNSSVCVWTKLLWSLFLFI